MSEFTKNGLINFIKKIEIPLAIFFVCLFSTFVIRYILIDKTTNVEIEKAITKSDNPDNEYYKSELSKLYDRVELFKSDLTKYGESDDVKKEYVSITKAHSDFSSRINIHNVNDPNNKLVLPSLEDIKNLSFDELLVIMFG